ncbi:MAG: branched-chain amino acid ABC transporter permease, partial [Gemmatimonadales bacterium]|nr:branched-chain amino acid ABC transporter permease [Gemmatimonadales bacterium]
VLIFSTTGVANFAQGELATFSGFAMLMLVLPFGLGVPSGWMLTLSAMGLGGALVYFLLIRPRSGPDHLNLTVRTLGLSMLLHSVNVFFWGTNEPYRFPSLFGAGSLHFGPVSMSRDQLGTLATAFIVGSAFFAFFRFTTAGLAMRAVAIDRDIAALQGVDVQRTTVLIWVLATILSAVVGLLAAPISFLEVGLMQPYILKAFTAAIIGGMFSFPGVIAGGLILGVAEAFAAATTSVHLREPFAFVILLLVLLLRPAGLFTANTAQRRV